MSLAMCATATIVVVEIGLTVYNLNKAGAFNRLKDKFKHKIDVVKQPNLKEITWNYGTR